jgi:hypothetical protein
LERVELKRKNFLVRLLTWILFGSRGGLWTLSGSFLSPKQYEETKSQQMENRAKILFDLIAPYATRGNFGRYGSKGDGGYVLLNSDIAESNYLISGGIESNNEFEIELAQLGFRGVQYDNSIDNAPIFHPNLLFEKRTLGSSDLGGFSLNNQISKLRNSRIILKLDIEGSEFNVLRDLNSASFKRIVSIVTEFHKITQITELEHFETIVRTMEHLQKHGFVPCFINPNNGVLSTVVGGYNIPENIEITFTRTRNIKKQLHISDIRKLRTYQCRNMESLSSVNIDYLLFWRLLND